MPVSSKLKDEIESRLGVVIRGASSLAGGCINNAMRIETDRGPLFLKFNPHPLPGLFEREAEGLRALHAVGVITVPEPLAFGDGAGGCPPYLVTTYIAGDRRAPDFQAEFGRRFARLHRRGAGVRFGFDHDNYLGSTPQPNGWMDDWIVFVRERRLGFQLRLAERNGHMGELQRLGARLLDRLGDLLAAPAEPPTLLHGDLWGGNYITGPDSHAALIDPAAYYGHREADLAMTRLFGGFTAEFYRAYEDEWPLSPGSDNRIEIYTLYHLLNHLNLFGSGYLGQCVEVAGRYAG